MTRPPHHRTLGSRDGSRRGASASDWHRGLVRGRPSSLGGGRLFPNRRRSGLSPTDRLVLQIRRDELFARLTRLDHQMVSTAEERLDILDELSDLRDELWPPIPWQRGRRPPAIGRDPLPPASSAATPIGGVTLRQACLVILARHGQLPLTEIHAWLHRYGYLVDGLHPVKVLADALGHEHDAGRAHRAARGVYELDRGYRPPEGRPSDPTPSR